MNKKFTTRDLVLIGMFAALMAAVSQISLPMPTGVPITIQVFGVALIGAVLGSRLGIFSTLVYILIGAVGMPVFSNFRGGFAVLLSVTGGYIWSWPVLTFLSGIRPKTDSKVTSLLLQCLLSIVGLLIVETVGGLQWALIGGEKTFGAIMAYSFVAFIPKDIVLVILAVLVGNTIKKRIHL